MITRHQLNYTKDGIDGQKYLNSHFGMSLIHNKTKSKMKGWTRSNPLKCLYFELQLWRPHWNDFELSQTHSPFRIKLCCSFNSVSNSFTPFRANSSSFSTLFQVHLNYIVASPVLWVEFDASVEDCAEDVLLTLLSELMWHKSFIILIVSVANWVFLGFFSQTLAGWVCESERVSLTAKYA